MHFAFVDADNLIRGIEQQVIYQGLEKSDIAYFDPVRLIETVTQRVLASHPDRTFVYYATPDGQDIPESIAKFGTASRFILRSGRLTHKDNAKKTKQQGVDVMLAIEAMQHSYRGKMDQCTLFSVDGDFLPLVDELVGNGTIVNVASFANPAKGDVAPAFQRSADTYIKIGTLDLANSIIGDHHWRSKGGTVPTKAEDLEAKLQRYGDWDVRFHEKDTNTVLASAVHLVTDSQQLIGFPSKFGAELYFAISYGISRSI